MSFSSEVKEELATHGSNPGLLCHFRSLALIHQYNTGSAESVRQKPNPNLPECHF